MNYIYDIMLNFNDYFFEFYDWNKLDEITEIRKIPIFRVSSKTLYDIKKYSVRFDEEFIDRIKNKTEYFLGRTIKLQTSFLLTDGLDVIALKVGKSLQYSSLQIEEELDILEEINMVEIPIKYEKLFLIKMDDFKTRNQIIKEKQVSQMIEKLIKENNISKIKYIYYECFNERENNIDKIINRLNKSLNDKNMILKLSKMSYSFNQS